MLCSFVADTLWYKEQVGLETNTLCAFVYSMRGGDARVEILSRFGEEWHF